MTKHCVTNLQRRRPPIKDHKISFHAVYPKNETHTHTHTHVPKQKDLPFCWAIEVEVIFKIIDVFFCTLALTNVYLLQLSWLLSIDPLNENGTACACVCEFLVSMECQKAICELTKYGVCVWFLYGVLLILPVFSRVSFGLLWFFMVNCCLMFTDQLFWCFWCFSIYILIGI